MSSMLQIRRNLSSLIAIILLFALAIGVAFYIVRKQRLQLPYDPIYTVTAEMPTGQALTPGQGQSATVAGVRVGEVAKVRLRNGRALVDLALDREKLPERDLRNDIRLVIRPRTPLQDMTVDIDPGSPASPPLAGRTIDVSHTTPSVNLDEIIAALDTDTRSWLMTMLQATGYGLKDRGPALRAAFRAASPTLESTRRVNASVAARRRELSRAIRSLNLLTTAVGREDRDLVRLVRGGDATFGALAAESAALRAALDKLPATLDAGREALDALGPLAREAGPAFASLVPAARALPGALRDSRPLLRTGTPALLELGRVSERGAPVVRDLRAALGHLQKATPDLTTTFSVLRRFMNELAYVPTNGEDKGYLFWLAWFAHNLNSFQGGQDANGGFWRGNAIASCSAQINLPDNPLVLMLFGPLGEQLKNVCPTIPER